MGIKLPQEIEVWYVIPAIRREFAKALVKKGLKQREVARMLGVTDAAVSQYFSSKRGSEVKFNQEIKKEIRTSVEKVMKGGNVLSEIQKICRLCKKAPCTLSQRISRPGPTPSAGRAACGVVRRAALVSRDGREWVHRALHAAPQHCRRDPRGSV